MQLCTIFVPVFMSGSYLIFVGKKMNNPITEDDPLLPLSVKSWKDMCFLGVLETKLTRGSLGGIISLRSSISYFIIKSLML